MISKVKKKLKVFHGLVNYGTQAGLLAHSLREQGVDAISVSYPDKFKRKIDIELLHGGNYIQKIFKHSWNWVRRFYWFFRYNTFHFYYGTTLFPRQWDLPFYKYLGKKVVMQYLGGDVETFQSKYTHYGNDSKVVNKKVQDRLKKETPFVDLQIVCAPYYSPFVENSIVIPLSIDLEKYSYQFKEIEDTIVIAHAPTNKRFKGTDFINDAIDRLLQEGFHIKFDIITDITHEELIVRYLKCDIFIDQIIAGWYGTAAIEAMASGKTVVAYINSKYFKYIEFGDELPIVNADKDSIYFVLKDLISNKKLLPSRGIKSRRFVEENHDLKKLTTRLISLYEKL